MKTVNIWQRLNTAFWLLILLLLAGVGLALWVAKARSEGVQRSDQLGAANDRIAYKMVLVSDTVRGLLLDPKNAAEKGRKDEGEKDLGQQLNFIQSTFTKYPDLMRSVTNLREFTSPKVRQVPRPGRPDLLESPAVKASERDPGFIA